MARQQENGQENGANDGSAKNMGKKMLASFREMIVTIIWAGVIAFGCRIFFFEPFNIPSGSMLPTLKIGDYLFVSKFSYGYGQYSFPYSPVSFSGRLLGGAPERGDVAVFRKPTDTSIDFIKRVVGLPGDTIQVIEGVLHVNGEAVERLIIDEYRPEYGEFRDGRGNVSMDPVRQYIEVLPNGVQHLIVEARDDDGQLDDTAEFTVPAGHYFVMGDNRDHSQDSRVLSQVGFIPVENFIGRATIIFFSIGEDGVRWGRILDAVE